MVERAKNLISSLYPFMHVLNAQLILLNIATSDAFNKIGLNNISSSAQVKIQPQEILSYFQMFKESRLQLHLSKNQTMKAS